MVEPDSCLLPADVMGTALSPCYPQTDCVVRNEVTSSWSGEVRLLPLGVVVQADHLARRRSRPQGR